MQKPQPLTLTMRIRGNDYAIAPFTDNDLIELACYSNLMISMISQAMEVSDKAKDAPAPEAAILSIRNLESIAELPSTKRNEMACSALRSIFPDAPESFTMGDRIRLHLTEMSAIVVALVQLLAEDLSHQASMAEAKARSGDVQPVALPEQEEVSAQTAKLAVETPVKEPPPPPKRRGRRPKGFSEPSIAVAEPVEVATIAG